ncbi:uncharacterized protein BXZ73DRAFT_79321 [Epithele typhae]|uniref:uncharacterized protein n=1 Tax=Epithele typhae TaxID=378194 RepID=UPI0020089C38|nr:uncharacterized protein BXZ73DRAFT_79321 [Epithele typhae]KAH9923915.1 hypothetical protein BXZ73DRAFT_79321 [Epithele typhae]
MASADVEEPTTSAPPEENVQALCELLDQMRGSMSAARDIVKSLHDKQNSTSELDTRDGISLLSLKHHMMLSYLQSLSLIVARRAIGHSLTERSPPSASFSAKDRPARGAGAGDRVDAAIEARVVLEKVKVLEGRMKYQIDKLVRAAEEGPSVDKNIANDPLAFRPNPQALMDQASGSEGEDDAVTDGAARDGIYRPPKLAPMPYTDAPRPSKDKKRARVPAALAHLAHLDPSRPDAESTSGLGGAAPGGAGGAHRSARARELARMTAFEEENFTRLVMKKRDARARELDEADVALGGTGTVSARRARPGGGLDAEFGDILRAVGRGAGRGRAVVGDGYEELRQRGKKQGVLARARSREDAGEDLGEDGPRQRKRSRFEKEVKASKKRALSNGRRA